MKPIFKLSGTLLLNQFLADIACSMCVIPFPFMFGDSLFTYILFSTLMIFFYYYISYHGAYKVGFHDVGRHSSDEYDKGYLKRGFIAAILAASPSIILYSLTWLGKAVGSLALQTLEFGFVMWNMFGYWPLSRLFPSHTVIVCLICIVMQIVFPLIGYICGYKGFVFSQRIKQAFSNIGTHK